MLTKAFDSHLIDLLEIDISLYTDLTGFPSVNSACINESDL